jgi:hypothetical protein
MSATNTPVLKPRLGVGAWLRGSVTVPVHLVRGFGLCAPEAAQRHPVAQYI